MATTISLKHDIATSTLFNLVSSESDWVVDAPGDFNKKKGIHCSWGLVQINICAHPEISQEDATNPQFALEYAAQAIENGTEDDDWTSCNCYKLVWVKVGGLPHMADIVPNTQTARVGAVAVFYYRDKDTHLLVKHIAYVQSVNEGYITIQEANKEHCLIDTRTIPISDPHLAGYWVLGGV